MVGSSVQHLNPLNRRLPAVKAANTTFQDIVLKLLQKYGYTGPYGSPAWRKRPVFIQSFEQVRIGR